MAFGLDIRIKFPAALKGRDKLIEKEISRAHRESASILARRMKSEIRDAGAVATGNLINSVRSRFERTGARAVFDVGSPLPYAYYVEFGRQPGRMPPTDAILKWMEVKGLDTSRGAYAVALHISKFGIKGRFVFKHAVQKALPFVKEAFNRAVLRLAGRIA